MKQLLENIKTRLSAKVPALSYIDENWGQLSMPNPPVKFPMVLTDIEEVQWSNQAKHLQSGIATVSIQLADMKLGNTNRKAPDHQRNRAAHILDIMSAIHAALHGWAQQNSHGPMTRTSTRKLTRDDGIRLFDMTYTCQIVDDSAKQKTILYPMTEEKIDLETQIIQ
ncbi:MAG: hypothetical protein ACNA7V_09405 [Bacteroidales bacterium]